jgi:hypothetical protein
MGTLYQDNTASVRSGSRSRSYTVANGSYSCADAKQRGARCKHQLQMGGFCPHEELRATGGRHTKSALKTYTPIHALGS